MAIDLTKKEYNNLKKDIIKDIKKETRKKDYDSSNENSSRLMEIIKARRESGEGITSSLAGGVKERLKEKFDPRRVFNQTGLLTALFPKLRSYKANVPGQQSNGDVLNQPTQSADGLSATNPLFQSINTSTKIIAKNSMVLPLIQKDTNLMRQTLKKIVKAMQVRNKFVPVTRTRPARVRNVPTAESKGLETEREEPEKEKGPIDILKDLVKSIALMVGSVGKAVTDGLSGLTDKIIKGVISGIKGLFTVGKLATSMLGRFMLPILGFMASPAGLAVMLGAAFFAILYRGFTSEERDAEKRKEYEELKDKIASGTASEADKRRYRELDAYGYGKEDIEIKDKIVDPYSGRRQSGTASRNTLAFLQEILAQKKGTLEYISDEDLKKGEFGADRETLQKWMNLFKSKNIDRTKLPSPMQMQTEKDLLSRGLEGVSGEKEASSVSPIKMSSPVTNFLQSMVSSPFGMRQFRGIAQNHKGVDIAGKTGDPIFAPEDGTVRVKNSRTYGKYVEILDEKGQIKHLLAHMSEITAQNGQNIRKGEIVGKIGSTGDSTGPHLHWEKFDESGNQVDPIAWLQSQNKPELATPTQRSPAISSTQYDETVTQNDMEIGSSMQQVLDTSQGSRVSVNTRIDSALNLNHPHLSSLSLRTYLATVG
jgi:murein DD-endopeptidase MepM/ murein hydrolase activator NlpD